ncbi:MAG: hypothetical protein FJX78_09845 [Armatimonadetes bacterium]|nr:hypothetical protein [Armatimonadota bacterium]
MPADTPDANRKTMMSELTSAPERDVADVLVEEGLLSPDEPAYADTHQRTTSSSVHRILSALGMVRALDVARGNARAWGFPYHDLAADPPQKVFIRRFPLSAMLEHHFVPVQQTPDGALVVAATYKPRPALEAALRET